MKGEKIGSLVDFLEQNGTKSTCYYANHETAVRWCKVLEEKNGTFEENPPFPWILGMLHPDQDERWTAHMLCDRIQEVNDDPDIRYMFSGLCCIHDDDESSESPYSSERSSRNLEETGASSVGVYEDLSKNHRDTVESPTNDLSSSQTVRPLKRLTPLTEITSEEIPGQPRMPDQSTTADESVVSLQVSQETNQLAESSRLLAGVEQQPSHRGTDTPSQVSFEEMQGGPYMEDDSASMTGSKDLHNRESIETAKSMSSSSHQGYVGLISPLDHGEMAISEVANMAPRKIDPSRLDPHEEDVLHTIKSETQTLSNDHLDEHASSEDVFLVSDQSPVQNESVSKIITSPDLDNAQTTWFGAPTEGNVTQAMMTASDQARSSAGASSEHERVVSRTRDDETVFSDNANGPTTSSEGLDQKQESRYHSRRLVDFANDYIAIEPRLTQIDEAATPSLPVKINEWPSKIANSAHQYESGGDTQPEMTDTYYDAVPVPEEQTQSASSNTDEDETIQHEALTSEPRLEEHQILVSRQKSGYKENATFSETADTSSIISADSGNNEDFSTQEQAEASKTMETRKPNSTATRDPQSPPMDLQRKFSFEENGKDWRPKAETIDTIEREAISSGSTEVQHTAEVSPVQPSGPTNQNGHHTCGKCHEALTGQFVRALGSKFHLECFTCQVSLRSKSFCLVC